MEIATILALTLRPKPLCSPRNWVLQVLRRQASQFIAVYTVAAALFPFILPFAAIAAALDELRWAGDPEGGAPFVEADPRQPDKLIGFDVEIAELIARKLGRAPRFVNITFTSIDQSVHRGDAEIGLSGIEDTPARRATMAATVPYYQFREVLSVRDADAGKFRTLADLKGKRVGTLGGTIAHEILLRAEREFAIQVVSYDDDVHPYSDLLIGRVDAVLLDNVLAERRAHSLRGFTVQSQSVAVGQYIAVLAKQNTDLRDRVDEILRGATEEHAQRIRALNEIELELMDRDARRGRIRFSALEGELIALTCIEANLLDSQRLGARRQRVAAACKLLGRRDEALRAAYSNEAGATPSPNRRRDGPGGGAGGRTTIR